MIKLLIKIVIMFSVVSCKQIGDMSPTSVITQTIKTKNDVENKKNIIKKTKDNKKNKSESIFYYLGDPYFIEGVKYIPEENYSYSEIGIATFYGKELHNKKTINNDYNKVTELLGRHKTLPIPSMVKLTNLDNGLSINIKIIDRFDDNSSLIQVSRKSAQLLGFYKNKLATVKIDILSDASKQWKNVALSLNEPDFNNTITSAPTEIVSIQEIDGSEIKNNNENNINEPIEISYEKTEQFNLYLKIIGFSNYEEIKSNIQNLEEDYKFTSQKNGSMFDLIIGPIENTEVNNLVSYFIAKGYKENELITKESQ